MDLPRCSTWHRRPRCRVSRRRPAYRRGQSSNGGLPGRSRASCLVNTGELTSEQAVSGNRCEKQISGGHSMLRRGRFLTEFLTKLEQLSSTCRPKEHPPRTSRNRKCSGKPALALPCLLLFLLSPACTVAQSTFGSIVGTVKDSSGALVPGASVRLTNSGTGGTDGDHGPTWRLPTGRRAITTA
jgi:hypothetical protein